MLFFKLFKIKARFSREHILKFLSQTRLFKFPRLLCAHQARFQVFRQVREFQLNEIRQIVHRRPRMVVEFITLQMIKDIINQNTPLFSILLQHKINDGLILNIRDERNINFVVPVSILDFCPIQQTPDR